MKLLLKVHGARNSKVDYDKHTNINYTDCVCNRSLGGFVKFN